MVIICACLPNIKPLFMRLFPRPRASRKGYKSEEARNQPGKPSSPNFNSSPTGGNTGDDGFDYHMRSWSRDQAGDYNCKLTTDLKNDGGSIDNGTPHEHSGIIVTTVLSQESMVRSEDTASTKRLVTEVL
jgi:hypothetical protein